MKQKGFAPIIIILVIALIGAGAYFLGTKNILKFPSFPLSPTLSPSPTPTPDPTANWKTYTANEFTFKYPVNWFIEDTKVVEDGSYVNFFLGETEPKTTTTDESRGNEVFRIIVYGDESVFSGLKNIVPSPTTITVSGKPALRSSGQVDILIGSVNKRVLHLDIAAEGGKSYIDQILSTFKFVD